MMQINRTLSKWKKTLIVNGYHSQKRAKKVPICYINTILALITKAAFKLQWYALVDDFEQHFENCVLNTQKAEKNTLN